MKCDSSEMRINLELTWDLPIKIRACGESCGKVEIEWGFAGWFGCGKVGGRKEGKLVGGIGVILA